MTARKIIGNGLMAFVLVSVGFAVGMEVMRWRIGDQELTVAPARDKVVVYYMHRTARCVTCNLVESMGEKLVNTEFAESVSSGKLEWKPVNYQKSTFIASHYNVSGNIIVITRYRDGFEIGSHRLDNVMLLSKKPKEFNEYLRTAISKMLEVNR